MILKTYIDFFVIVFVDDILICLKSIKEHDEHLRVELGFLREIRLYAEFLKCELDSVSFLGHVLSKNGVMVDPTKIEAVKNWEAY